MEDFTADANEASDDGSTGLSTWSLFLKHPYKSFMEPKNRKMTTEAKRLQCVEYLRGAKEFCKYWIPSKKEWKNTIVLLGFRLPPGLTRETQSHPIC